jgi:hypothetical protein
MQIDYPVEFHGRSAPVENDLRRVFPKPSERNQEAR